jgi:hypothetical protein
MKKARAGLVGSVLLCLAYAGTAAAQPVKIDPNGYGGQWTVDYGDPQRGPAIVNLGPEDAAVGAHVISVGGAEIYFRVGANGKVSVRPDAAATGGLRSLRFNTTRIKVDPGLFAGYWRVVDRATPRLTGAQVVTLIRGLDFYSLEVGPTGGFFFHVGADGTVSVPNALAASGGLNSLSLNSTERFLK